MNVTWSERVEWCELAGLSLAQIAQRCQMAYSTLNDIKTGRTKEPAGMRAVLLYRLSERHRPKAAA